MFSETVTADFQGSMVQSNVLSIWPLKGYRSAFIYRIDWNDCEGSSFLRQRTSTLPFAELVHRALVSRAAQGKRVSCAELIGQAELGQPMTGPHAHAHVLPIDLDCDGTLDHLLLYADMGFNPLAQSAMQSLMHLYTKGGLLLCHLEIGELQAWDRSLQASKMWLEKSWTYDSGGCRTWRSISPFVPVRYLKKAGKNGLEGQVNSELASRNLPSASVEVLEDLSQAMKGYIRHRCSSRPPQDVGFALRLRLSEPAIGPIALGYASHFGMGLFEVEKI